MKRYNDRRIFEELNSAKRGWIIFAAIMLWAAWQINGSSAYIAHIARLRTFDSQQYYSLVCALNSFFMCIAVPLIAGLSDRIGRKWLICAGITMEIISDIGTAFAPNIYLFTMFWTISGFTSGCFISAPYLLVSDVTKSEYRSKYMGYIQAAGAIGMLVSPVTAGFLADHGLAELSYLQCIPFIFPALVILFICYPDYRPKIASHRIDFIGIMLMLAAVGLFIFLFNFAGILFPWKSLWTILAAVGILLLGTFLVKYEEKEKFPVLAVNLLARPQIRIACFSGLLFNFYAVCSGGYIILYVQNVMERTATTSGAVLMPQTIVFMLLALLIGRWGSKGTARFRTAYIAAGIAGTIAMAIVASLNKDSSVVGIYIAMVFGGVMYSVVGTLNIPYAQKCLKPEEFGAGQGTVQFFTTCTSCLVLSVFSMILNSSASMEHGLKAIYVLTGGMSMLLALYAFKCMKEPEKR